MSGINKVILVGHIGEISTKDTKNGGKIATISLATSKKYLKEGVPHEQTEWHNIVFFKKSAEIAERFCNKGDKLFVEGELKYEQYTDKHGIDRRATKIIGHRLELMANKTKEAQNETRQHHNNFNDEDDEIPF